MHILRHLGCINPLRKALNAPLAVLKVSTPSLPPTRGSELNFKPHFMAYFRLQDGTCTVTASWPLQLKNFCQPRLFKFNYKFIFI